MAEDYPIWSINGVQHSPSDLPLGHWVNSSGLVVQARTELDGTTYRCTSLSVGLLPGGIPTVHSHNSDLFELAVTQSGMIYVHEKYIVSNFMNFTKFNVLAIHVLCKVLLINTDSCAVDR